MNKKNELKERPTFKLWTKEERKPTANFGGKRREKASEAMKRGEHPS